MIIVGAFYALAAALCDSRSSGGFNRETEREGVNVNPLLAPLLLCNYVIRCRVTKILMLLPSLPLLFLFRR